MNVSSSGRILVVDDEAEISSILAEMMHQFGFSAMACTDAATAMVKLQEFKPDVLLADVSMPGMNGLELLKVAREMSPDTAVIMMSGTDQDEDRDSALAAGARCFFNKPFDIAQMIETCGQIVQKKQGDSNVRS